MSGPLTLADITAIWRGGVDESYSSDFEAAGEGNGFEAYTQGFAQFARVSEAIDRTTQGLYIRPWSGQTDSAAQGEAHARVTLSMSRGGQLHRPLVLPRGYVVPEEETTDWGQGGGETVLTGRRYVLIETLVFHPGEMGPFDVIAEAERPGYGYNNPLPGTIKHLGQPGDVFANDFASVEVVTPAVMPVPPDPIGAIVVAFNEADAFIPNHVGQYVLFTAGTNAGRIGRATQFTSAQPSGAGAHGGKLRLAQTVSVEGVVTGTFEAEEPVTLRLAGSVVGYGVLLGVRDSKLTIDLVSGVIGDEVVGDKTGANVAITATLFDQGFSAESVTAAWRMLSWASDWLLTITNAASPAGGRLGMLDLLGAERDIRRAPDEGDELYSKRVHTVADVVSPNAIRRAVNRTLGPYGITHCFREVGSSSFRGFFYDAGGSAAGDDTHPPQALPDPDRNYAYDMNFTLRPADRFKVMLSFADMRAFFLIGVPRRGDGEFGFPYDGDSADPFPVKNAYDRSSPLASTAYDGYPRLASLIWRSLWAAIDDVHAGGVGFDLYIEDGPCP